MSRRPTGNLLDIIERHSKDIRKIKRRLITGHNHDSAYVPITAWDTWSPTITGYDFGSTAAITARYRVVDGIVSAEFHVVLGGTGIDIPAGGAGSNITLPVAADDARLESQVSVIGRGYIRDDGTSTFNAIGVYISDDKFKIASFDPNHGSGWPRLSSINDTTPITHAWAADDKIHIWLEYEAE